MSVCNHSMTIQRLFASWFGFAAMGLILLSQPRMTDACLFAGEPGDSDNPASLSEERDYRQPIDAALSPDEKWLAVASLNNGTISVIHLQTGAVASTLRVATGLNDLESASDGLLFAVSKSDNALITLVWNEGALEVTSSTTTSMAPVHAEWVPSENLVRVSCLWSRRVESFTPANSDPGQPKKPRKLHKIATWDVDVAPRIVRTLPGRPLAMVADAFGSHIAMVNTESGKTVKTVPFLGFGVVGMIANDQGEVGVAYGSLNDYAHTSENDIHWGVLLANDLRWVSIDRMLEKSGEEVYQGSRVQPVGVPGNGGAELTSLSINPQGKVAITVGGTNQLAISSREAYKFRYVDVGKFPVASVVTSDGSRAYVVNRFEDSISIVDMQRGKLVDTLWLGKIRTLNDVEKGERLFHDSSLSHDRWLTCASCHVDGHTNGQLADNLGDRTYGAPKRVISLLGSHGTSPFSWLGHDTKIQKQIVRSVQKTMQSYRQLDPDEVEHVAAYCESLAPPPSLALARGTLDEKLVDAGRKIFESSGCVKCHAPPSFTTANVYDVGMVDEKGAKLFNPPSLLGVSQRGPYYFHDNRAEGLRGVIHDYQHKLEKPLDEKDEQALLAFLQSL